MKIQKEIEARIYDNKVLRINENIVKKIKTKNQVMNKRTENLRKKEKRIFKWTWNRKKK